ncbi:hypothetical protein [Gloeobacter morelensis]|uniref:Uncharacterized protein n=1 Tax=Gloeobacter morelensis MG652769 TaxID=2781736 RepID=A0ABY3PTK5_9CYAN|nr:hypothetical protein [Gloeobacter morelensis]UFP96776.1 hypothetical protein ISF26_11435 [Gloeobacter morelensis MG652769]
MFEYLKRFFLQMISFSDRASLAAAGGLLFEPAAEKAIVELLKSRRECEIGPLLRTVEGALAKENRHLVVPLTWYLLERMELDGTLVSRSSGDAHDKVYYYSLGLSRKLLFGGN